MFLFHFHFIISLTFSPIQYSGWFLSLRKPILPPMNVTYNCKISEVFIGVSIYMLLPYWLHVSPRTQGFSGTDTVVVVGFCPVSNSWSFNYLFVTTVLLWPALYCCNHRPTNPIMSGRKLIIYNICILLFSGGYILLARQIMIFWIDASSFLTACSWMMPLL